LFDIIIKNGKIIDGTGNPWFKADLGIKNGKIAKIGCLSSSRAEKTLDADGLIVCPGFIDMHSHSDFSVIFNPKAESTIRQGVTTLVVGNCGMSLAPVNPAREDLLMRYISPFLPPGEKLEIKWSTFSEYLKHQEKFGVSSNIANLVGHGTVRIAVMGFEERTPTKEELGEMKMLVAEAMEAGAFGMSTGLIYPPGIYSKTEELIELAGVVAKYGGIYTSHIRGEGTTLIEAVKEAIEIGEEGKLPIEISHHKAAGKPQWGKSEETLRLMEEARERGVEVTCDQYPYKAGMTSLVTLLPPWAHQGGMNKLLERLRSPEEREKMRRNIEEGIPGWENFAASCGWENIYVSSVKTEKNKPLEGKNIAEIAKIMGKPDEFTALCELLLEEEGAATMVLFMMDEEDIRRIMKHPLSMVGSDSWSVAPYGILGVGKPHPRFYGTYPKILGEYVRENKTLSLEEAIRKMTSLPAQKIGLWNRGLLREGTWADIVIFNPDTVKDKATYQDPHQYPEGIEYVLVNGQIVVELGEHTGILTGKILHPQMKEI
jgi:N-acyl-D-amino-acid deacylase